jgi:hypothetical protein
MGFEHKKTWADFTACPGKTIKTFMALNTSLYL